jgi:FkbH-like protein
MFEIDQYQKEFHAEPIAAPEEPSAAHDKIDKVSLLFWGEHCTECAAPGCYQTCDLYQPRPDGRCRRFGYGIHKNRHFSSIRGYGAEISFKKWGRIVAAGNTAMERKSWLLWKERWVRLAVRVLTAIGPAAYKITGDDRWRWPAVKFLERFGQWLHRRNSGRTKPDAFLVEVYNPAPASVRMQLLMDYLPRAQEIAGTDLSSHRFRTTVTFPKGYSRYEFERRFFQHFTESGLPFNIALTPEADSAASLVFLTADFVTFDGKQASAKGKTPIKCVVWDLDNTLWDGTLVETDEVRLKPDLKELLETLDQRGILMSVASKNNHDAAWSRLQAFGISEYFLFPQINWGPKSASLTTIAKRLNIGLDALAFVDDNPFERNEVMSVNPDVHCIDPQDLEDLRSGERFRGSATADAKNRRRYYQDAIVREEKQTAFGEDYVSFLRYCEIELVIESYRDEDFDRVAELIQRTNQLNFSGHKYGREQLREVLAEPALNKYVLSCSDKFGVYGVIGFCMTRNCGDDLQIDDLMLSCRVQGKLIEQTFFSHLETYHNPNGAKQLYVKFRQTNRNQPARQALEAARFKKREGSEGYERDVQSAVNQQDNPVHVKCFGGCHSDLVLIGPHSVELKII